MVMDLGERLNVDVRPIAFSVDWYAVRLKIVEGLRDTGYWRYVGRFGPHEYKKRERLMERRNPTPNVSRPNKRRRIV
jgi:hypothetical protein